MSCVEPSLAISENPPQNIQEPIPYFPMNLFSREKELYGPLQNLRIIQKNLVYIIGLSKDLIQQEVRTQI